MSLDAIIPEIVLSDTSLSNLEKLLFGIIYQRKDVYFSNKYLGKILNVGPQSISNAIAILIKKEIIIASSKIEKETGHPVRKLSIPSKLQRRAHDSN